MKYLVESHDGSRAWMGKRETTEAGGCLQRMGEKGYVKGLMSDGREIVWLETRDRVHVRTAHGQLTHTAAGPECGGTS